MSDLVRVRATLPGPMLRPGSTPALAIRMDDPPEESGRTFPSGWLAKAAAALTREVALPPNALFGERNES